MHNSIDWGKARLNCSLAALNELSRKPSFYSVSYCATILHDFILQPKIYLNLVGFQNMFHLEKHYSIDWGKAMLNCSLAALNELSWKPSFYSA